MPKKTCTCERPDMHPAVESLFRRLEVLLTDQYSGISRKPLFDQAVAAIRDCQRTWENGEDHVVTGDTPIAFLLDARVAGQLESGLGIMSLGRLEQQTLASLIKTKNIGTNTVKLIARLLRQHYPKKENPYRWYWQEWEQNLAVCRRSAKIMAKGGPRRRLGTAQSS